MRRATVPAAGCSQVVARPPGKRPIAGHGVTNSPSCAGGPGLARSRVGTGTADGRSKTATYAARALARGAVSLPDRLGSEGPRALGPADGRRRARGGRADPPDA